jgi:hypothetical protein
VTAGETRLSRNGKQYPAAPLTREQLNRARNAAHFLVHSRGMSVRRAQQVMAEDYGIRRSVGIIARDLADFVCTACDDMDS